MEIIVSHGIRIVIILFIMSNFEDVLSYKNFVHAVAGAIGSVFSITIMFPVETARFRLQVDEKQKARYSPFVIADIFKEEGLSGVYCGWFSTVMTLFTSNLIYFYIFHGCKFALHRRLIEQDASKDLIIGILSGTTMVLIATPLWVVSTRIRLQNSKLKEGKYKELKHPRYSGLIDGCSRIAKEEGVSQLWNGLLPSLLLVSNPAIQFMIYELLKRTISFYFHAQELSPIVYFIIGGFAKAVATFVTYPMQVVQARTRAGFDVQSGEIMGMVMSLKNLISSQGLVGLYRGLESKMTQTVLTAAIMFLVYEEITLFVFKVMDPNFWAKIS